MKIAFTYWDNRIAPVFDTARQILIVEITAGTITSEITETLPEELPVPKIKRLKELGTETLICGAISRAMHQLVISYGIQIIPFIAGDLKDIIQAWLTGNLDTDTYAMPGCCRHRRRFAGTEPNNQEVNAMSPRGRGMGAGGGMGQGQGGQRPGRMGGPRAAGPSGFCVCPQCGHQETHQRGVPCVQRQCSQCGTMMIRQ